ncbi:predicted protein [Uncinocarpus reesii 1704]|uniref:Protein kinase domain-containing protein n=1 Tax=Uncinocarpus reesii (strain UAMH 1704) TaxID=336963 RepID=C4JVI7_UNCRE|nr:uncharacterized protein UREG_06579 [Uncinocarpus reesii 1704]EEP81714.1 predicted protein [Uncinocarpus reesii 1704]
MAPELSTLSREELLRALEEQRRLRQQAEADKEKAERDKEKAEEDKKSLEKQLQPSTLPEHLDACHVHLSVGISSRVNYKTGTQGNPENAGSKLRPNHIREWTTFPQEQSAVWKDLFDVDFASERHFTSLSTVKDWGNEMQLRLIGSELDLGYYQRHAVEDRVSLVIRRLYSNRRLRDIFNLKGEVMFENHGNTITENERSAGPQVSPVQKRQKKADVHGDSLPVTPTVRSRSSRPRADQFCVYNTGREETIPAFIIEYKAPHKLTLGTVEAGLMEIEVDDVVVCSENDDAVKLARRRVAAVITQLFSYMIYAELEFGYVCTGQAFIFLRVDPKDPTTVYYYLSVPNDDVGMNTGWVDGSDSDNKLHLTAVGQVLAFTLRALKTRPFGQIWRNNAESQLKRWEIEHDDILFGSDIEESGSKKLSDYKQNWRSRNEYIRVSPIKTRSKRLVAASSCRDTEATRRSENDDSSGSEFDSGSPSAGLPRHSSNITAPRPPSTGGRGSTDYPGQPPQWCTQKCLLGLRDRGPLDPDCPNVASHGIVRHAIDDREFCRLARAQILAKAGPSGCESMHRHGTSGALFWLTLFPYRYSLVAKALPVETVARAKYEEYLYQHLQPIQGVYIPVCLGGIDISPRPLWYDGIFEVVHLLFLSHAGRLVKFHANRDNFQTVVASAVESLQAIHKHAVLHRDAHGGNMFWNAENQRVMVVDLERARILDGQASVTKKRKRQDNVSLTGRTNHVEQFKWELRQAQKEMLPRHFYTEMGISPSTRPE